MRPLVVRRTAGDQRDVDWTSLSRKHAIERDDERNVVTVFGGKLTDCLNVGEEVAEAVEYVASAEWTTGAVLTVDGGLSLGVTNA